VKLMIDTAPDLTEQFLRRFHPPFDLTSDMLVLIALGRTAGLRDAFPHVPFLSFLGRTPLVVWFSRVTEARAYSERGDPFYESNTSADGIYREVNVVALLSDRAVFVPVIYATEARTVALGRGYYGMPKQVARVEVAVYRGRFQGALEDGVNRSAFKARLVCTSPMIAGMFSRCLPRWTWPAGFPSGGNVRALILATAGLQLAVAVDGQLELQTAGLRTRCKFLPLGIHLSGIRMRLPDASDAI
jgi:hypothetical protein